LSIGQHGGLSSVARRSGILDVSNRPARAIPRDWAPNGTDRNRRLLPSLFWAVAGNHKPDPAIAYSGEGADQQVNRLIRN